MKTTDILLIKAIPVEDASIDADFGRIKTLVENSNDLKLVTSPKNFSNEEMSFQAMKYCVEQADVVIVSIDQDSMSIGTVIGLAAYQYGTPLLLIYNKAKNTSKPSELICQFSESELGAPIFSYKKPEEVIKEVKDRFIKKET